MKIYIHGQNFKVTEALQQKIEHKLEFLSKYFLIYDDTRANVMLKVEPQMQKIEVTIFTKVGILRAEVAHEDLYAAIDLVIDKLEDQIVRQKTRLSRKHRSNLAESFVEIERSTPEISEDDVPVRTKTINPEPMDLEEAILRMEMLGHSFFIYFDKESDQYAVIYKRNEGGFGLIEIENR